MMKIVLFFPFSSGRVSPVEWKMVAFHIPRLMREFSKKNDTKREDVQTLTIHLKWD